MKESLYAIAIILLFLCAIITFYVISYNTYGRFADRFSLTGKFYHPARVIDENIALKKLKKKLACAWQGGSECTITIEIDEYAISVSDTSTEAHLVSGHYNLVGTDSVSVADDKVIYLLEMKERNLLLHANDVYSGKAIAPVKEFKKLTK